jgi:hypothetical protein
MSAHTPGPWRYLPGDVPAFRPIVQRGSEGGFIVQGLSREREDADAKLIAASPELLEALEELVEIASVLEPTCLGDGRAKENRIDRARAAIALATGAAA